MRQDLIKSQSYIASYQANLVKPSVVSNTCISLASKPPRHLVMVEKEVQKFFEREFFVKVTGSLRADTRTVYLIKRYFILFLSPKIKPCDPTWTWKTVLKQAQTV